MIIKKNNNNHFREITKENTFLISKEKLNQMMLNILCRQIFSRGRKKNALELELISRAVIQTVSEAI